jgi:hypothetical protein
MNGKANAVIAVIITILIFLPFPVLRIPNNFGPVDNSIVLCFSLCRLGPIERSGDSELVPIQDVPM